jgi:DNA polymerase-3 subunit epsilon
VSHGFLCKAGKRLDSGAVKMKFTVFDTETTGINVGDDDQVIEIAAVDFDENGPTDSMYYTKLKPKKRIHSDAMKVHGISDADLVDAPSFRKEHKHFLDFIEGKLLIAHNAEFDVTAIDRELERIGSGLHIAAIADDIIDSLDMAKQIWPGRKNNLDAVCKRCNVSLKSRKLHGAHIDCIILGKAFNIMRSYKKKSNSYVKMG